MVYLALPEMVKGEGVGTMCFTKPRIYQIGCQRENYTGLRPATQLHLFSFQASRVLSIYTFCDTVMHGFACDIE